MRRLAGAVCAALGLVGGAAVVMIETPPYALTGAVVALGVAALVLLLDHPGREHTLGPGFEFDERERDK